MSRSRKLDSPWAQGTVVVHTGDPDRPGPTTTLLFDETARASFCPTVPAEGR